MKKNKPLILIQIRALLLFIAFITNIAVESGVLIITTLAYLGTLWCRVGSPLVLFECQYAAKVMCLYDLTLLFRFSVSAAKTWPLC